jgi:hypothetical protein
MIWFTQNAPRHMRLFELIRQQHLGGKAAARDVEGDVHHASEQWDIVMSRALLSFRR